MATPTSSRRHRPTRQVSVPVARAATSAKSLPPLKAPSTVRVTPRATESRMATAEPSRPRVAVVGRTAIAEPSQPRATAGRTAIAEPPPPDLAEQSIDDETSALADAIPSTKLSRPARAVVHAVDSLASVQGQHHDAHQRPRWFKIATWLLVLMPAFSIGIYIIGFFYFLPFEQKGIGLNASFNVTPIAQLQGVLIPDQEGVFLQHGTTTQQGLDLILQYNSTSLQPPVSAQVVLAPSQLHYILIRQAQVETADNYQVFRLFPNKPNQPVPVVGVRVPYPRIALIALSMPSGQNWVDGQYMVVVPESGLDSADYWVYFTIKG